MKDSSEKIYQETSPPKIFSRESFANISEETLSTSLPKQFLKKNLYQKISEEESLPKKNQTKTNFYPKNVWRGILTKISLQKIKRNFYQKTLFKGTTHQIWKNWRCVALPCVALRGVGLCCVAVCCEFWIVHIEIGKLKCKDVYGGFVHGIRRVSYYSQKYLPFGPFGLQCAKNIVNSIVDVVPRKTWIGAVYAFVLTIAKRPDVQNQWKRQCFLQFCWDTWFGGIAWKHRKHQHVGLRHAENKTSQIISSVLLK